MAPRKTRARGAAAAAKKKVPVDAAEEPVYDLSEPEDSTGPSSSDSEYSEDDFVQVSNRAQAANINSPNSYFSYIFFKAKSWRR